MSIEEKKEALVSQSHSDLDSRELENGIAAIVSPTTGKHIDLNKDGDDALKFVMSHEGGPVEIDPELDRKLLWKIDMYLLPLICILYAVQYMDKTSNASAAIMGLRTDLNMKGDMYAWTGSAFYLGYLAFELPFSFVLQRFPVVNAVSAFIVVWGVILCLHATPNYEGFVALRTLLGAFESTITPAFVIITSQWYRKEEVFFRTALWFSFNGVGILIGSGAIAYNLLDHMDSYSIEAWKLIFVITGVITIALGIAIFFHIPNNPTQAWFLTEEEKVLVVERIRVNQQGFGNKHFKKYQFIEALLDIKTWLFFFLILANTVPNGGLTNFSSILLNESLGYTTKKTLLMQMIPGAVEIVGCPLFAYGYKYYPSRLVWAFAANCLTIVGLCMLAFSSNTKAQFAGLSLYNLCPIVMICGLASSASNIAGHTKKLTVNAIFLMGYCVGNLIGPQTFIASQSPSYNGAKVAMVVCSCAVALILILIWFVMSADNKRRDAHSEEHKDFEMIQNHEFADLTDKENPLFRYTL